MTSTTTETTTETRVYPITGGGPWLRGSIVLCDPCAEWGSYADHSSRDAHGRACMGAMHGVTA